VFFSPEPELMRPVPLSFKIHVTAAWTLLGFSPFSRLVHIWGVPVFYLFRRLIVFRRKPECPPGIEGLGGLNHGGKGD